MISIAIDGPAGAGKSTIAKEISKILGFVYVDTGALYRAIGLYIERHNIEDQEIKKELSKVKIDLDFKKDGQHVFLCGEDVSKLIRTPKISMIASRISAFKCVRDFLLKLQRDFAEKNNVVMDGRDIGTVVLPDAEVKIFLTASAEIRAQRRYNELRAKNIYCSYDEVLNDIIKRDKDDSSREIAPLRPARSAIIVDTSNMSLQESIKFLLKVIKSKFDGGSDLYESK